MPRPLRRAAGAVVGAALVAGVPLLSGGRPAARTAADVAPIQAANPDAAPTEAGTGAVSGVVTDGATGAPLAGAVVYLGPPRHGPPGGPLRQITDAKGRFLFRDLPAFGGYFINVTRPGYFDGYFGRGSSGALGARIALGDGQWFADANVSLFRLGAISGRVVDERGDPVVEAYVRVLLEMRVGGRTQLVAGPVAKTDDRGLYRISSLDAGRYLVQVPSVQHSMPASFAPPQDARAIAATAGQPSNGAGVFRAGPQVLLTSRMVPALPPIDGRFAAYPPTFHPGARETAGATWIELARGESRTGVDVGLSPVPTFTVSGRVTAPAEAYQGLTLRLMPSGLEYLGDGTEAATTMVAADGTFVFLGVPVGSYTLVASPSVAQYQAGPLSGPTTLPQSPTPPGGARRGYSSTAVLSGPAGLRYRAMTAMGDDVWWGRLAVDVNRADVRDLIVPLHAAATLSGRFVWDPAVTDPPDFPRVIRLEPADGNPTLGTPRNPLARETTDAFTVTGLLPGSYVMHVAGPHVKSVMWDGRDYADRPFDASTGQDITDVVVTLTTASAEFVGSAVDERGEPATEHAVIVFPADRTRWSDYGLSPARIKALATTNTGGFRFQSLPEGDYLAACVGADLIDGWKDPAFLAKLAPLATPVPLRWGTEVSRTLREVHVR